jgi:hypothetical protein
MKMRVFDDFQQKNIDERDDIGGENEAVKGRKADLRVKGCLFEVDENDDSQKKSGNGHPADISQRNLSSNITSRIEEFS